MFQWNLLFKWSNTVKLRSYKTSDEEEQPGYCWCRFLLAIKIFLIFFVFSNYIICHFLTWLPLRLVFQYKKILRSRGFLTKTCNLTWCFILKTPNTFPCFCQKDFIPAPSFCKYNWMTSFSTCYNIFWIFILNTTVKRHIDTDYTHKPSSWLFRSHATTSFGV